MTASNAPTVAFFRDAADELFAIGALLTRAVHEVEWTCAKADRFRSAMDGRSVEATGLYLSLQGVADRLARSETP
ncbi:MAG: hypothetical protein V9G12_25600 [Microthrixaceae bacterium]